MTAWRSYLRDFLDALRVRYPIGESLAVDGFEGIDSALRIINAKCRAVVVAKVKLREVAVQVVRAAMLVDASHTALEHTEEAFNRVRGRIAVPVLVRAVVHGQVLRKLLRDLAIHARVIGRKARVRGYDLKCLLDPGKRLAGDVDGAGAATALNQGKDHVLVTVALCHLPPRLAADVGLISLDNTPARTHETGFCRHGVADTVGHKPRRFIGHAKRAMQLMAADTFLARTQQVDRREPFGQRNLAALENRPHGHGELLPAVPAEVQTIPVGLAAKLAIALRAAAVRTGHAIRPTDLFQMLAGGVFVTESGGV